MFVCFLKRVKSGMNWSGKGGRENIRGAGEGKTTVRMYCTKKSVPFFYIYFILLKIDFFLPFKSIPVLSHCKANRLLDPFLHTGGTK